MGVFWLESAKGVFGDEEEEEDEGHMFRKELNGERDARFCSNPRDLGVTGGVVGAFSMALEIWHDSSAGFRISVAVCFPL